MPGHGQTRKTSREMLRGFESFHEPEQSWEGGFTNTFAYLTAFTALFDPAQSYSAVAAALLTFVEPMRCLCWQRCRP